MMLWVAQAAFLLSVVGGLQMRLWRFLILCTQRDFIYIYCFLGIQKNR